MEDGQQQPVLRHQIGWRGFGQGHDLVAVPEDVQQAQLLDAPIDQTSR
jgi:hypothetical protein